MNQHSLAYLMSESGALIQLKPNSVLQNFKSYNILLFYILESKVLYNWVGREASTTTIEHIENAERLILGMHPDMTVLRHITIKEQDKDSLPEFLNDIGIRLDDYKERLKLWREFEISVYSDIQKLKIIENNSLILNELNKALEAVYKIIDLADKIHDFTLVSEKKQSVSDIMKKMETHQKKKSTLNEINKMVPELNRYIQVKDIEQAVSLYNEIILLYKSINKPPSKSHQEVIDSYIKFYNDWEQEISS